MVGQKENSAAVNAAMVRRRFRELDKGNLAILDELFDSAYLLHFPGISAPLNLAATKRFYQILYSGFPGLRHTILEQVSARNKVVTRWTASGTHRGDWMGIKATGKRVTFSGINIYTLRRGRLAESQVNWDILGLAQQIGATTLHLQFRGKRAGGSS